MYTIAGHLIKDYDRAPRANIAVHPLRDDSIPTKSVQWFGTKDIRVIDVGKPLVTDPQDAIIRVTSSAICGSDLHLYLGMLPGMKKHDIMGHEFTGIVESVGAEVKTVQPGDRVVVAFCITDGTCLYCRKQLYSCCDTTNPSKEAEALYGHATAGIFGYSHLTGGFDGGQADYDRVHLADNNTMKLPGHLPDDKIVLLSDILPTAWHANELAGVKQGDSVCIFGAGPVGMLAAHCAQVRGASRVVLVDKESYRLDFAQERLPGLEIIDFSEQKTLTALHDMFSDDEGNYVGPDCCIEAVGFHYTSTWLHWLEMAVHAENDPSEILNEIFTAVRKGGRVGVVGVYSGYCNHLNIGAFMEKGLYMAAGQCPVQKYWKQLLEMVEEGVLKPEMVITHHMPLEEAAKAYKMFNEKEDGCMKVVLKPGMGMGGKEE